MSAVYSHEMGKTPERIDLLAMRNTGCHSIGPCRCSGRGGCLRCIAINFALMHIFFVFKRRRRSSDRRCPSLRWLCGVRLHHVLWFFSCRSKTKQVNNSIELLLDAIVWTGGAILLRAVHCHDMRPGLHASSWSTSVLAKHINRSREMTENSSKCIPHAMHFDGKRHNMKTGNNNKNVK